MSDGIEVALLGLSVLTLQVLSGGLAGSNISLNLLVVLLALDDLRLASGGLQVGGSNVQVLSDDSAVDLLVNSDTNGSLGDVEHNTGSAVVVLEGHTLVNGGINLDVNVVSSLEESQHNKN